MHTAWISIGSNLGNREQNIKTSLALLTEIGEIEKASSIIETIPQEVVGKQNNYLNVLVQIQTRLEPKKLFDHCIFVEQSLGRNMEEKNHKKSRVIDLDIIGFDDEIIEMKDLKIPHPRMHQRDFVLIPLVEIHSTWRHPILLKTAKELLDQIQSN